MPGRWEQFRAYISQRYQEAFIGAGLVLKLNTLTQAVNAAKATVTAAAKGAALLEAEALGNLAAFEITLASIGAVLGWTLVAAVTIGGAFQQAFMYIQKMNGQPVWVNGINYEFTKIQRYLFEHNNFDPEGNETNMANPLQFHDSDRGIKMLVEQQEEKEEENNLALLLIVYLQMGYKFEV